MSERERRTQELGRRLADGMRGYRTSPVESLGDRAMLLLAGAPRFRSHLLRFIDALAGLETDRSGRQTQRLLREYLARDFADLPPSLRPLLPLATWQGWPAPLVAAVARQTVRAVASRFIVTGGPSGALAALRYLSVHGRLPSFDLLGEYVASEGEADIYRDRYLDLVDTLGRSTAAGRSTRGGVCQLQLSLKLSALTADFSPIDPAGTLQRLRPRLEAIAERAIARGIGVTLDMERYETRDLVLRIFLDVFGATGRFGRWSGIGVVLQAYLRDSAEVCSQLLRFAEARAAPFQIRLVKGAYWDYETVVASDNGWPVPVWQEKWQTDLAFERLTEDLVSSFPRVFVAIASHNLRSHAYAESVRESLGLPDGSVEHQTLYRTAEGITRALTRMGWTVRDYVPLGNLLPGMAYLVRRILENSSQSGFLLHSRSGESIDDLLLPPTAAQTACGQARHESASLR